MPSRKTPCWECKAKHLKCDEDVLECSRCRQKKLRCVRPGRKRLFREGCSAKYDSKFSTDQDWVESQGHKLRWENDTNSAEQIDFVVAPQPAESRDPDEQPETLEMDDQADAPPPQGSQIESQALDTSPQGDPSPSSQGVTNQPPPFRRANRHAEQRERQEPIQNFETNHYFVEAQETRAQTRLLEANSPFLAPDGVSVNSSSPASYLQPRTRHGYLQSHSKASFPVNYVASVSSTASHLPRASYRGGPIKARVTEIDERLASQVTEVCLVRYFVEELSLWFDITDPHRQYGTVVPAKAQHYRPLLNAICAVAARHLCRIPKYNTSQGIVYHGQLLAGLNAHSAVEYMLECIPVLKDFYNTKNEDTRELIVVMAVILRQFEEIDDGDGDEEDPRAPAYEKVNFLGIMNSVMSSLDAADLLCSRELLAASYWISLRQEVYYALRKGYAPRMVERPEIWHYVSLANSLVMHSSRVGRWMFEDRSTEQWSYLKEQERLLEEQIDGDSLPILLQPANKARGEILPVIWYKSPEGLTGMQYFMIAKIILLAESPMLERSGPQARAALRHTEDDVRSMILALCGMALQHPHIPPALVHATLGIILYGDYFTDPLEIAALKEVTQKFKEHRAWPVPEIFRQFE